MGTPSFALPVFEALVASAYQIIAVYTKPPKPFGRGYELAKSAIHLAAEKHGIPVLFPSSLKTKVEQHQFAALKADIAVVAAYGLLLPKAILDAPVHGCINIHPSMLPRWRGAAPLQHTILAGDTETEVCIMQMDEGMDTGGIIFKEHLSLPQNITTHELHDLAANTGAHLTIKALETITKGKLISQPQKCEGATHAHKLTKADEKINWQQNAFQVYCRIKTFAPRPGAHFIHNNEMIKIIEANFELQGHDHVLGTVVDDKLKIACGGGYLIPMLMQREGKKMIYTDAFLRGYNIAQGTVLI